MPRDNTEPVNISPRKPTYLIPCARYSIAVRAGSVRSERSAKESVDQDSVLPSSLTTSCIGWSPAYDLSLESPSPGRACIELRVLGVSVRAWQSDGSWISSVSRRSRSTRGSRRVLSSRDVAVGRVWRCRRHVLKSQACDA